MTTATEHATTTVHVYRVYIKATPQAIWNAITQKEWAEKYGYACPIEFDLRPGGAFRGLASEPMRAHGVPDVILTGEVIEANPPHKLVQTWHPLWDPASAAERPTRLTYEIEEGKGGVTTLTVTHDVAGAPLTGAMVTGQVPNAGGGWPFVLSDHTTLLETGKSMAG